MGLNKKVEGVILVLWSQNPQMINKQSRKAEFTRASELILPFFPGSVLLIFCGVGFRLFVFVLCLVWPMKPVSLDCPLLIIHSVFVNIYLTLHHLPVVPHIDVICFLVYHPGTCFSQICAYNCSNTTGFIGVLPKCFCKYISTNYCIDN